MRSHFDIRNTFFLLNPIFLLGMFFFEFKFQSTKLNAFSLQFFERDAITMMLCDCVFRGILKVSQQQNPREMKNCTMKLTSWEIPYEFLIWMSKIMKLSNDYCTVPLAIHLFGCSEIYWNWLKTLITEINKTKWNGMKWNKIKLELCNNLSMTVNGIVNESHSSYYTHFNLMLHVNCEFSS